MTTRPDRSTIRSAVERTASVRRNRYRDDRYQHFTEGAFLEQVCGVERDLVDQGDGWWLVGRIVDALAHFELEVVCCSGETIWLREIMEPVVEMEPPLPLLPERPTLAPVSSERGRNPLKWDEW